MRRLWMVCAAVLATGVAVEVAAQDWTRVSGSRKIADDRPVDVHVAYGAGRFVVSPVGGERLYRMTLRYNADQFRPVEEFSRGVLRLGTETVPGSGRIRGMSGEAGEMELELSRDVPMDLDLEFGAVQAEIDLGGLQLTGLELKTGASETRLDVSEPNPERMRVASLQIGAAEFRATGLGNLNAQRIEVGAGVGDIRLDFTGRWEEDGRVSVAMGLGSLELRLPRGLGVKLVKDTFLTSLDSEGLVKRGDAYYSLDYDDADVRLTIEVKAAFGSVDVVWVR